MKPKLPTTPHDNESTFKDDITCIFVQTCAGVCVRMCVYEYYTNMYMHTSRQKHTYMYIDTHICIYTHTSASAYTYTHMYIHMSIH